MWEMFVLIFIVVDPFGTMILINQLLKKHQIKERRYILFRENLIAMLILLLAVFAGDQILAILSLDASTLRITGGIILFLISIKLVYSDSINSSEKEQLIDPFIVPIAMPLIAGPSVISIVILFSKSHAKLNVVLAIFLVSLTVSIILFFSPTILKCLGKRGIKALEQLMGMLLIMISIQMILDGVREYLSDHGG